MIRLRENKSQIWFKVLSAENLPIDGSSEDWSLPKPDQKGTTTTFQGKSRVLHADGNWVIDPRYNKVTWLVSDPNLIYKTNSGLRIYVVQIWGTPVFEIPGMIWVHEASLIREATSFDLKPFGIYRAFSKKI